MSKPHLRLHCEQTRARTPLGHEVTLTWRVAGPEGLTEDYWEPTHALRAYRRGWFDFC